MTYISYRQRLMFQRRMTSFLRRLKNLRKKSGLTQQDVATRLSLNQATYSAMEGGRQSIILDYLFEVAEAFGLQVWQLFVDSSEVTTFAKEDQHFFEMWQQFNDEEREIIKGVATQIAKRKELEVQSFKRHSVKVIPTDKPLSGKIKKRVSRVVKRISKNHSSKMVFENAVE